MSKQQMRLRYIEGGEEGGGGNPPTPANDGQGTEPVHLPDDHPLVKTLAAQKTEIADLKSKIAEGTTRETALQRQIDGIEQAVAGKVRDALIGAHKIAGDAAALITGTTSEDVVKQVNSVLALSSGSNDSGAQDRLAGHNAKTKPSDEEAFVKSLFGGES